VTLNNLEQRNGPYFALFYTGAGGSAVAMLRIACMCVAVSQPASIATDASTRRLRVSLQSVGEQSTCSRVGSSCRCRRVLCGV